MTRTGLYIASLRAARDGFREGFAESFMQASPLFLYSPRRNVKPEVTDRVQELMENTWEDISGIQKWLMQVDDAIDYSIGVSYVHWSKIAGEVEKPVTEKQAYGDIFDWTTEMDVYLDQPEITRIHPFNYACDPRTGHDLTWEGCEWEWGLEDFVALLDNPLYEKSVLKNIIQKITEGKLSTRSNTYYNVTDRLGGHKDTKKVYVKEYWGLMREVPGMEGDTNEYCVMVCDEQVFRINVNKIRGKSAMRPFKRTRLCPLADLPIGLHILAPTLTHQRFKNLLLNLTADDVIMRQHLGLAVWPNALKNPNDLLNPEGARGVLFMKDNASINQLPRFFADGRSGLMEDVFRLDDRIDRDAQMAGISDQTKGYNVGGGQNQTATGQRILASNASRRSRTALMWTIKTGLEPIGKDIMLLTLRNKHPDDLGMEQKDLINVWDNNYWKCEDSVMTDRAEQAMALANFSQVSLQYMAKITTEDGSANHMVGFLKDLGRAYGIPGYRLDTYLPNPTKPEVGPANSGQPAPTTAQQAPLSGAQPPAPAPTTVQQPLATQAAK